MSPEIPHDDSVIEWGGHYWLPGEHDQLEIVVPVGMRYLTRKAYGDRMLRHSTAAIRQNNIEIIKKYPTADPNAVRLNGMTRLLLQEQTFEPILTRIYDEPYADLCAFALEYGMAEGQLEIFIEP